MSDLLASNVEVRLSVDGLKGEDLIRDIAEAKSVYKWGDKPILPVAQIRPAFAALCEKAEVDPRRSNCNVHLSCRVGTLTVAIKQILTGGSMFDEPYGAGVTEEFLSRTERRFQEGILASKTDPRQTANKPLENQEP